ncbi:MAG: hypothetical protein KKH22_11095, partial [Proteobacteria bacterium]|nr:hypothetical protein [Pseudomonadota bacterium]
LEIILVSSAHAEPVEAPKINEYYMNQSFDPLQVASTGVQFIEASAGTRKAPFDRLRANGSYLEIILVSSAHAEPVEAPR